MTNTKKIKEIKNFLKNVSSMNGGQGLLIGQRLAKRLKGMGITEGYSVLKPLPEKDMSQAIISECGEPC